MNANRQLVLGLFVIAVLSILATYTLFFSDVTLFGKDERWVVHFPEAKGLRSGDAVMASGLRVGRVVGLSYDPRAEATRRITAELSLREEVLLREDARILIEEATLLGGRQINIEPGSPELGLRPTGPGAVLFGEVAPSPLESLDKVSELIEANRASVDNIIANVDRLVADTAEGKGTIGRLLVDTDMADHLSATMEALSEVADDLSSGRGTLGRLISEEELYGTIETIAADFETTMANLRLISEDLEAGRGAVGKLMRDEDLALKIENVLADLETISGRLKNGEGTIGRLLVDDTLARNLESVSQDLVDGSGVLGGLIHDDVLYANVSAAVDDIAVITRQLRDGKGTLGKILMEEKLYDDVNDAVELLTQSLEDYREAAPVSTFTSVLFGAF